MESFPIYYLLGPTAVGKSELAVAVAERVNAEIIGADAFQVYEGLDILTAKPSLELRSRVPHHLISEVPLTDTWDVVQWLASAESHIRRLHSHGKAALVAGGTGLYIRALTRGFADLPPPSPALRAELATYDSGELVGRLRALDPVAADRIDTKNPRRVIRALEVCILSGQPFSSFREEWEGEMEPLPGFILVRDREELYGRIDQRTRQMFADGVLEEVRNAGEIGTTAKQALGLHEIQAHLAGEMPLETCIAAIQQATRRYAKRQLTWFRRENAFETITLGNEPVDATAARLARALCKLPG